MLRITRRDFLKYCSMAAGALGLSCSTLMKLENVLAKEATSGGVAVMWLDGAACTGCSMSLLNSRFLTTVDDILLNRIDLDYHKTIMSAAGSYIDNGSGSNLYGGANSVRAAQQLYASSSATAPTYVLCVEGGIQTAAPPGAGVGDYCHVGQLTGSTAETMLEVTRAFASRAIAVLAIGTCASFGGIPGSRGNVTGSKGLLWSTDGVGNPVNEGVLNTDPGVDSLGIITTPVVNISGCPPHPDWIVGTIAHILDTAITLPTLDWYGRPVDYGYGEYQCNAGPCPWRYNNTANRPDGDNPEDSGAVAEPDHNRRYPEGDSMRLGREKYASDAVGCLGILGCKGRKTKADCSRRRWNTDVAEEYGVNWCVGSRGSCHGCTDPRFPDKVGKFFTFA